MNAGMKMLLATTRTNGQDNSGNPQGNVRNEEGARMGYDNGSRMEYRNEARYAYNNRMGYDTRNEYSPRGEDEYEGPEGNSEYAEGRFRDRRGRPHYENGRFAPRNEMQNYGREESRPQMHYQNGGSREKQMMGFGTGEEEEVMPLTQFTAEKWARGMKGMDGNKGPHWSVDQTQQLMKNKQIDCDPWEFYAAMNAIYSDYAPIFQKYGVGDNIDFYIDMAKAFIDDPDAQDDKLARYFKYVVKH